MKNSFVFFLYILLLLGCETKPKLTFETTALKSELCTTCTEIQITIPKATGELRVVETINTSVNEEIIALLKFDDSLEVNTVSDAMQSFTKSYLDFKNNFNDEQIPWQAEVDGHISFENDTIISLLVNTYTFTGGAHGYVATTFLNFDVQKNKELEPYELFYDLEGFITFAEKKFRIAHHIPLESAINATGYMFSNDVFHLPENLGFTKKGITLVYNQYEIASYADGPVELTISYNEARKFLKEAYQVK